MAKYLFAHVKSHRSIHRFLLFKKAQHHIDKSVHRIGINAFRVSQKRHAVKGSVRQRITIDYD